MGNFILFSSIPLLLNVDTTVDDEFLSETNISYYTEEDMSSEDWYAEQNTCQEQESCCTETCCPIIDCCCENHYYIGGEYLYWRAWQGGLDRAGLGPEFPGTIKSISFDWEHGFRVTAGAEFCCDWGLSATYTYLRPSGKKTLQGDVIFPTTLPQFVAGGTNFGGVEVAFDTGELNLTRLRSSIKLNYNLVDIELAKFFNCTSCFDFQVSTGVQIGWIDEKISDFYFGDLLISVNQFTSPLSTGNVPVEIDWIQTWDFEGAGLRFGAGGTYKLGCGFFLSSNFHMAALFGEYKTKNNRMIPIFDTSGLQGLLINEAPFFEAVFDEYYFLSAKENFFDFVTNLQLDFQIGWEYWCKCVGFKLSAAYEVFYWVDLAIYRQGLAGDAAITSDTPTEAQFLFAGTSPTSKFTRDIGFHGLVISLDIIY